jgi:exodeoxyribonuclease VII small subunit
VTDHATQHTYETAAARLEGIIKRLDSGEAGLRETLDLCREGRELVEFCAAELDAVGKGLEELRLDELVARLEAEARGPGLEPESRGPGLDPESRSGAEGAS